MTYCIHWYCWTNQLACHVLQCCAVAATSLSLLNKIQSFAFCQSNIATEHGHVTKRYIIYAHPLSWLNFHCKLWNCQSCWIIWLPTTMGNPTTGNPTTNGNSNNQTWLGNLWEIDQFDQEIHPENLRSQRTDFDFGPACHAFKSTSFSLGAARMPRAGVYSWNKANSNSNFH